jgi:hypothetical protein
MSAVEVARAVRSASVSNVPLSARDISNILDMLVYDGRCDYEGGAARRAEAWSHASRALFPYAGARTRSRYEPSDGVAQLISLGYDEDEGDGEGGLDEDAMVARGVVMQLKVGGAAESRVGAGPGFARRALHTAALASNSAVEEVKRVVGRGRGGAEGDDDDDDDEEEEDIGFRGRGGRGGKAAAAASSSSSSQGGRGAGAGAGAAASSSKGRRKGGAAMDDDDDEEAAEEEDDEDDDDDEDEMDDVDDDVGGRLSRVRYIVVPPRGAAADGSHADYLRTVPCGVCPVTEKCTPGGVVSPETCVYFSAWLEF